MSKELLKKISFLSGAILAFAVGLLFTVLGDLELKSGSPWLIGGVLLTFGSAVCVVLSDIFKEKGATLIYILRGIAIALIAGFIGYLVAFHSAIAEGLITKPAEAAKNDAIFIVLMILSCLTFIIEVVDVVFVATLKEE